MGHKRSVDALYKSYVLAGRTEGTDLGTIPTRNRNEIYKWAEEDEWERHARESLLGTLEQQTKMRQDMRSRGYHKLALLTDNAIETLLKMMGGGDATALKAAIEVLDRAGVVRQDKIKAEDVDPDNRKRPALDATEEDILNYLSDKAGSRSNG